MQTVKKYNVFLREVTLIVRALAQYFTLPVRGVVLTRRFSTVSYPDGALTPEARHPLRKEKTRQFLTSNGETIVCVHPAAPQDFADTKVMKRTPNCWLLLHVTDYSDYIIVNCTIAVG